MWHLLRAQDLLQKKGPRLFAFYSIRYLLPFPWNHRLTLLKMEWDKGRAVPLSLHNRLLMLRHGFTSPLYYLYRFNENQNYSDYVSELQKVSYTQYINGDKRNILDNKFEFHAEMTERGFENYLPKRFGAIGSDHDGTEEIGADRILQLLDSGERLILKSATGAGGKGVYILSFDDGNYVINSRPADKKDIKEIVSSVDGYIVSELSEQARYAAELYSETPNTLRVLTMHPGDDPFIAIAAHRIGTRQSVPVDNWSQGGLSAQIDVETGELGPATQFPFDGKLNWFDKHPDSDVKITGKKIPGWDHIQNDLLNIADKFSDVPYIGWDILVTDRADFVLIEGNNQCDMDLLQVHKPLLVDKKLRNFYAEKSDINV